MQRLPTVRVSADLAELTEQALEEVRRAESAAVDARGAFHFVFSGGSTPRGLYAAIAASIGAGWSFDRWHVWFGDERWVPLDHADSNYAMAEEALLRHVPIPRSQVHRIRTELETPAAAAAAYEQELHEAFGSAADGRPAFDLVLMGMGDDGHTGSLFPGSELARANTGLVVGGHVPSKGVDRVSLTAEAFNTGRRVVFLVAGAGKARTVLDVLRGDEEFDRLPAQRIRPEGSLVWLLDRGAAGLLDAEG